MTDEDGDGQVGLYQATFQILLFRHYLRDRQCFPVPLSTLSCRSRLGLTLLSKGQKMWILMLLCIAILIIVLFLRRKVKFYEPYLSHLDIQICSIGQCLYRIEERMGEVERGVESLNTRTEN